MLKQENQLYTLIPIDDFKSLMGVDDREDKIARFCLLTSTLSIEQFCKRRFLRKKYFEQIGFYGDERLALGEFPINKILSVYAIFNEQRTENKEQRNEGKGKEQRTMNREQSKEGIIIEPEFYRVVPGCGTDFDVSCSIEFSPAIRQIQGLKAVRVIYFAGYPTNKIPADLASACMELAMWNMNRYRGRRIGMTGNVRGSGRDGEHFEMSMPSNVRQLLEPYRRKVI